jgi:hypothetical protein
MTAPTPPTWIDGNALAGPLADVFAFDMTVAVGRCAGCGRSAPLAEVRAFTRAAGLVARCPACDTVLLRMVRAPGRIWLDLRGIRSLQIELPDSPA